MKKLLSILLSVIVFYILFIVSIKSTHFNQEQVYFEYKNEGLSQLADSLVAKKIIYEKTSFLLLAKALKVEDKIKAGRFLVKKKTSLLDLLRMLRNKSMNKPN
jgi:cell division protein YceG involved in septum cleavage